MGLGVGSTVGVGVAVGTGVGVAVGTGVGVAVGVGVDVGVDVGVGVGTGSSVGVGSGVGVEVGKEPASIPKAPAIFINPQPYVSSFPEFPKSSALFSSTVLTLSGPLTPLEIIIAAAAET